MTAPYSPGPTGPYSPGPYSPGPTGPYSPGPSGPPAYWAPAPPPPPSRPRRTGTLLAGATAGVAVMAVIGAVLALTGVLQLRSSAGGAGIGAVDGAPVAMPDTLGGYRTIVGAYAALHPSGEFQSHLKERWVHTSSLTGAAYSAAFGGAGAGVQGYSDDKLEFYPTVIAIRARAPGLTNGVVNNAADLNLARNQNEVVSDGDVQCIIFHTANVLAGRTPDPDDLTTTQCLRSGNAFSVYIFASGADGEAGRATMVKLTDAAYEALSAG